MKNISLPQGIFSIKESINAKKKRFRNKFKSLEVSMEHFKKEIFGEYLFISCLKR